MNDKKIYKLAALIISLLVLIIIAAFCLSQRSLEGKKKFISQNMEIKSSAFENNQSIPKKYTCDGENISPPLEIKDVSEDAKSLVLIVDDPDAPGGTWDHWTVWNIKPDTSSIKEDEAPEGAIEGINGTGENSYYGPCPPSGVHHYHFKIFALDKILEADSSFERKGIEALAEKNVIDFAELIGTYERK